MSNELFTSDNTESLSQQQLDALNILWETHCRAYGIEEGTMDYHKEAQWFSDLIWQKADLYKYLENLHA